MARRSKTLLFALKFLTGIFRSDICLTSYTLEAFVTLRVKYAILTKIEVRDMRFHFCCVFSNVEVTDYGPLICDAICSLSPNIWRNLLHVYFALKMAGSRFIPKLGKCVLDSMVSSQRRWRTERFVLWEFLLSYTARTLPLDRHFSSEEKTGVEAGTALSHIMFLYIETFVRIYREDTHAAFHWLVKQRV